MAQIFAVLVTILIVGWLWFVIVRPILVDFGVIVDGDLSNVSEPASQPAPCVSSSVTAAPVPSVLTVSQTDSTQTDRQPTDSTNNVTESTEPPKEYLTLYKLLREHGISREQARPALKAAGVPLDNNLWSKAVPVKKPALEDDDELITPFAGRRTKRSYYPDRPDMEYQPLDNTEDHHGPTV